MDIEKLPEPKTYPSVSGPRCQDFVKPSSCFTARKCTRVARFSVDGVNMCEQHAGSSALYHLINPIL